ncbi:wax ester/triacylglycerol synthase family O-acyltransferase [Actinomadura fulvescens]|uniref:wax ester/triacylglycerol synthase domain-containing protein n=1 Tax=Actinomadura fulvescens TaxID=46160 RepID=UPI0031E39598
MRSESRPAGWPDGVPLTFGDHYTLCLSDAAVDDARMHIVVGARMPGPPPTPRALRGLVADRVAHAPVLAYRLAGAGRRLRWVPDPAFEPADHVEYHRLSPGQSPHQAVVAAMRDRPLSRGRPLWSLLVLHGYTSDEHLLCYRAHHAFQDGLGVLSAVRALTGDESLPHPVPDSGSPVRVPGATRRALGDLARLMPGPPRWYTSGDPGTLLPRLHVGSLAITPFREIARESGAGLAQIALAVVAGALGEWTAVTAPERAPRRGMTVPMPVSLRGRRGNTGLGNQVGLMPVVLPCAEPSPRDRLRRVVEQTSLDRVLLCRRGSREIYRAPPGLVRPILRCVLPFANARSATRLDVSVLRWKGEFPGGRDRFSVPPLAPGSAGMIMIMSGDTDVSVSAVFEPGVRHTDRLLPLLRQALGELHAAV